MIDKNTIKQHFNDKLAPKRKQKQPSHEETEKFRRLAAAKARSHNEIGYELPLPWERGL